MAIAFDVKETRPYVLKQDRGLPPEQQTTFHLGVLDARLATHLKDSLIDFAMNDKGPDAQADVRLNRFGRDLEIARFGLKNWENLFDRSGQQVPFEPKLHTKSVSLKCGPRVGLTDIALDLLKPYLAELAGEIESDNWLDEVTGKNSESPSS